MNIADEVLAHGTLEGGVRAVPAADAPFDKGAVALDGALPLHWSFWTSSAQSSSSVAFSASYSSLAILSGRAILPMKAGIMKSAIGLSISAFEAPIMAVYPKKAETVNPQLASMQQTHGVPTAPQTAIGIRSMASVLCVRTLAANSKQHQRRVM